MRHIAPTENEVQKAIVDWISWKCPLVYCFAVPNKAVRTRTGRAGNACPGLRPGVPDMCLLAPGQRVYMIEVKRKGGVLSDVQKQEIPKIQSRDVPVAVVYSLDEAIKVITRWGLEGMGVVT